MDVWVERERLDTGDLPSVCVVTSRPAIGQSEVRYSSMPSWMYVFGALPVLLTTQDLTAWLPVAEGVVERHNRRMRLGKVGVAVLCVILVPVVLGLVALGASSWAAPDEATLLTDLVPWLIGGLLGIGVLAGVAMNRSGTFVDLRPDHATGKVRIMGAHPDFAAALADEEPRADQVVGELH